MGAERRISLKADVQGADQVSGLEVVAEETGVSPDTVWKSFQPQEEGRGLFRDYDLDC